MNTPRLLSTAYQTGIQTGIINEFKLDDLQHIHHTYSVQQNYNDYVIMQLSGLLNKNIDESQESIKSIARYLTITLNAVINKEETLLLEYEKTVDLISS